MASIQQRSGSYRVRWRLGGTRDSAWESLTVGDYATAVEVKRRAELAHHAITGNDLARALFGATSTATVPTVVEWVEQHVASLDGVIKAGTRAEYDRTVKLYLKPSALGATPLPAVTRQMVQLWVNGLIKKPLAPKTVANHHGLLAAAMSAAVDEHLIDSDPCRNVSLPRADTHTDEVGVYLTAQEVERLTALMTPDAFKPIVTLLVRTGLRWGEASALHVSDVDLLASPPTLRVSRAWQKGVQGDRLRIGEPKTRRSRRTVSLDAATVDALLPLCAGRDGSEWLFTTFDGKSPVPYPTFRKRWLLATSAFGKDVRVHDLRHTHASWLIQAGVPLPVIQRRLGHESITTTVDRYGHLAPDSDVAVLAALDGQLATTEAVSQ